MMKIIIISLISFIISFMVLFSSTLLSKKHFQDREKSSPFECGFDPFSSSRLPFSLRFFMISIIFLIFDIEIALILPLPLTFTNLSPTIWLLIVFTFIITLLLGLFHEWNQGALEWSN